MSDIFCYYTTNDWEKLIDQEDEENTASIVIPILTTIYIYIGPTKFLEKEPFEIEYNTDSTICGRYPSLDWHNNHKGKIVKKTINKNDNDETSKQKVRQIRENKQQVKHNVKKKEI